MDQLADLRHQFQMGHQFLEGTMADVSPELARARGEGWAINPIAAIYAHVAITEDAMIQQMVRGQQTVLERDGWGEKLGLAEVTLLQAENASVDFDLAVMREYAAAVAQETDAFLESPDPEALAREVDTPVGKMTAEHFLVIIPAMHVATHWGEIAALKGVHGLKGLPF